MDQDFRVIYHGSDHYRKLDEETTESVHLRKVRASSPKEAYKKAVETPDADPNVKGKKIVGVIPHNVSVFAPAVTSLD